MNADILRKHLVELVRDMRDQASICEYLQAHCVLTQCNKEEVMCGMTNSDRNWKLVDFIRCRFKRAYPLFLDALERTNQYEILELFGHERVHTGTESGNNGDGTCAVCLEHQARFVFVPCGHLCTCQGCSQRLSSCPLCRSNITQRVAVYQ
jgi:hypothetical protein